MALGLFGGGTTSPGVPICLISVSTWGRDPCTCLPSSKCTHPSASVNIVEGNQLIFPWKIPHSVVRNTKKRCQVRFCKVPSCKISLTCSAGQDAFVRLSVASCTRSVRDLQRRFLSTDLKDSQSKIFAQAPYRDL